VEASPARKWEIASVPGVAWRFTWRLPCPAAARRARELKAMVRLPHNSDDDDEDDHRRPPHITPTPTGALRSVNFRQELLLLPLVPASVKLWTLWLGNLPPAYTATSSSEQRQRTPSEEGLPSSPCALYLSLQPDLML
jgi:hypothetical protein